MGVLLDCRAGSLMQTVVPLPCEADTEKAEADYAAILPEGMPAPARAADHLISFDGYYFHGLFAFHERHNNPDAANLRFAFGIGILENCDA